MEVVIIWYCGDWHGKLSVIGSTIMSAEARIKNGEDPITIVQVGDFGWGYHDKAVERFLEKRAKRGWSAPIYTCLGNHDNWDLYYEKCNEYSNDSFFEMIPGSGVFIVKRGHVVEIDGIIHAFLGGAESIDRHISESRGAKDGNKYWWKGEEPNMNEFNLFHDNINKYKAKVLVTHEAPLRKKHNRVRRKQSHTAQMLERLYQLSNHQPRFHVYGHHHVLEREKIGMTEFVCCGLHGDYFSKPGGLISRKK